MNKSLLEEREATEKHRLSLIPSKRIIGIEEEEEKINFNSHNLKRQSKISFNQPRISIPTDILNVSLPPTINIRIHLLLERCRGHACSQSYEADGTNNGRTEANQRANVSKTIEETYASSIHRNIF